MEELVLLLALTQKQEQLLKEEVLNMEKFDTLVNKKERIINQLKEQDLQEKKVFNEEEKAILFQITELDKKNKEILILFIKRRGDFLISDKKVWKSIS